MEIMVHLPLKRNNMKKRRVNKKKIAILTFILLFSVLFIISIIKIINYMFDNKENRQIQKIVSEAVSLDNVSNEYQVDFKLLKKDNNDTVAYLQVPNTNIDYVVVKSDNNSYYLSHNFNKKPNISGWIFADYHNKFDGTDKNIIIYGHNTWDGSMFGTLKNTLNKDWYQGNKIMLVTEDNINYYEVFSTYSIKAEDYYITTSFNNDNEFDKFVKELKSRSVNNYNVEVSGSDKILTLSTCTGDGKKRVVLHAKLITE